LHFVHPAAMAALAISAGTLNAIISLQSKQPGKLIPKRPAFCDGLARAIAARFSGQPAGWAIACRYID